MQRFKAVVSYVGSRFSGWQSQPTQPHVTSVQDVLEAAISKFAAAPVDVVCAGRTDAGVHALAQVVHFDLPQPAPPPATVAAGLSYFVRRQRLGSELAIVSVTAEASSFHARFSARARHYLYRLVAAPPRTVLPSPFLNDRAWQLVVHPPLDVAAMRAACARLEGTHDFTSLRAINCSAESPVRTVTRCTLDDRAALPGLDSNVEGCADVQSLAFRVSSQSFLYHQVRNMVGLVVRVGRGAMSVDDIDAVLAARSRAAVPIVTSPPQGLYLERVDYETARRDS
eukprot:Amastigsp_a681011_38.p1 type:complete len:283 gc:universal Amastigsp_a681011_38:147-995(+)